MVDKDNYEDKRGDLEGWADNWKEDGMALKVTSWNVEDSNELNLDHPSINELNRIRRIQATIDAINPDILCLVEAPKGEIGIQKFSVNVLNGRWVPVFLPRKGKALGTRDKEYQIQQDQWIWFLVRNELADNCTLQDPATWQSYIGHSEWEVNLWGQTNPQRFGHFRHPQVMIYDLGGGRNIEFIGVHLKSKINKKKVQRDAKGHLTGAYLADAMKSRIRLATEARNIREYISQKFKQVPYPGIVVMGDCNDGPGHDYFEKKYLFFDLISNIQGDVMLAERFFNHALFDYPGELRWTAKYDDDVSVPKISAKNNPLLLDNIFISQPLCRGQLPFVANEHAGIVEHEIYERVNAGSNSKTRSSDHRPITCVFEDVV